MALWIILGVLVAGAGVYFYFYKVYDALAREARALEEAMGVDTSDYVFLRPEGTSARWKAPGEWIPPDA